MSIDEELPLLRTFRAELAKRSSMLVDEDMMEFFTQQFEETATNNETNTQETRPYQSQDPDIKKMMRVPTRTEEIKSHQQNRTSLTELSMTLKSLESPVTAAASPTISATSTMIGSLRQEKPPREQTVIAIEVEEIIPRGQILHVAAIINPQTRRKVTLVEALQSGLIDARTKMFIDPSTRQRLSLPQAAKKGFIDEMMLKQLTSPCGLQDTNSGQELSLSDAIQRKIYHPQSNSFTDTATGEEVTVVEAVSRGIISESCSRILAGEKVKVTSVTHTKAIFGDSQNTKLDCDLSLGKLVEKGQYSEITGKVISPYSSTDLNIMDAVEKSYINPNYEEIEDSTSGKFISLTQAVNAGIIDPFKGTFYHMPSKQKLSLTTAMNKGYMKSAVSIADIVTDAHITEEGDIFDPISGQIMPMSEAFSSGVVSKVKKCLLDPRTDKALSVSEAVSKNMATLDGKFYEIGSPTQYTLIDAVKEGIVKLVNDDVEFSRSGIKDPRTNEVVTFSEALKRGILTSHGTYVDNRTGKEMSFQQAANSGLMDRTLVKDLSRPTSLTDADGHRVSTVELFQKGLVDPQMGNVEHPRTKETLSMQEAVSSGLISSSDATSILSLISHMTSSTTVITQAVDGTSPKGKMGAMPFSKAVIDGFLNEHTGMFTDPLTGREMPIDEAVHRGLLKLSSDWPDAPSLSQNYDQIDSNAYTSISTLSQTFMTDTLDNNKTRTIPIEPGTKTFESGEMTMTSSGYSFTVISTAKPLTMKPVISEVKEINLKSIRDPRSGQWIEVEDAIQMGLVDLQKGKFMNTRTGATMSLNEAIEKGHIIAEETTGHVKGGEVVKETRAFSIVGVIHPKTKKRLTVSQAIKDGILDQDKGIYNNLDARGRISPMKISEAIKAGYVIVEDLNASSPESDSILRETKSYTLKTVIHPISRKHMSVADAIAEGIIHVKEGVYLNPATGKRIPIHEAIEKGLILATLAAVKTDVDEDINKITTTKLATLAVSAVVDPCSGKIVTLAKAIEDGIIDQSKGIYINPRTGESMTISDAIDKRLVLAKSPDAEEDELEKAEISSIHITEEAEPEESTLMEDVHSETVTMSIGSVIDPKTMEMISYEDALKAGILDLKKGLYMNPVTREKQTIAVAMGKGLIHGEVTSKRIEDDTLRSTVSATTPTFSLRGTTSVQDPRTGKVISLDKAIKDGIINPDRATYYNPKFNTEIPLEKAKELGYIHESKFSNPEQIEQSLEEENIAEAQLQTPKIPLETNKPWSKVDMELEKTFAHDESLEEDTPATEVLHYSLEQEEDKEIPLRNSAINIPITQKSTLSPGKGISFMDAVKLGIVNAENNRVRDLRSGEYLTLQEAIDRKVIDPSLSALQDPSNGKEMTLEDCLEKRIVRPTECKVDEMKAQQVGFTEESLPVNSGNVKTMNIIDAVEAGLFNKVTKKFMEPVSGHKYNLQQAINNKIIDGAMVTVKDMQSGERVPLNQAIAKGLISGTSSEVYDTAQRKTVPLIEAINKGYIQNIYDLKTGSIVDSSGELIPLRKAIVEGDIKTESVVVVDSKTGKQIPFDEAYMKGMVDRSGFVIDKNTGNKMSPTEAMKFGLLAIAGAPLIAGKLVVDAIKEKAASRSSTEQSALSSYQASSQSMYLEQSRQEQAMSSHNEIKIVTGPSFQASAPHSPFEKSQDPSSIQLMPSTPYSAPSPVTKETMIAKEQKPISVQLRKASPQTLNINWETGMVTNQTTNQRLTVIEAVQKGLLDSDTVEEMAASSTSQVQITPEVCINWELGTVSDQMTGESFSVDSALQRGLIDSPTASSLASVTETASMYSKSENVQQLTPKEEPYTLNEAVRIGKYHPGTGQLIDPKSGLRMSVRESLSRSVIDGDRSQIIDPQTGRQTSLRDAIDSNIFDPLRGEVVHKASQERIPMQDAYIQGLIPDEGFDGTTKYEKLKERKPSLTLQEAINKGYVDQNSGTFRDPLSGEIMSLAAAIEYGLISDSGEEIAQERPIQVTRRQPTPRTTTDDSNRLSFAEALDMGFINLEKQQYTDPASGNRLALLDAITEQIIDTSIPSERQTSQGLSLTKAIDDGIFDEKRGIYQDPNTGESLNFQEAVLSGKLDPKFCMYEVKTGEIYSLEEGLEEGKLDPQTGMFIDEEGRRKMTLKDAAKMGALAIVGAPFAAAMAAKESVSSLMNSNKEEKDIEPSELALQATTVTQISPNMLEITQLQQSIPKSESSDSMTLMESISSGYLNPETGAFKDPVTGKQMQVSDAIMSGVINKDSASVRDPHTNKPLNLEDALRHGVIDDNGLMVDPRNGRPKDLKESISDGIVSEKPVNSSSDNTHSMFLKSTEKMRVDSVYDPISRQHISLQEAIEKDVVNLEDAVYQNPITLEAMNLTEAVDEGRINAVVLDKITTKEETTKLGFTSEVAFAEKKVIQVDSVLDTETKQDVPLAEAVKRGIIDEDGTLFKDRRSGTVMPLDEAVQHGFVSTSAIMSEMETKKSYQKTQQSAITQSSSLKIQSVVDPATNRKVPVSQAVEKGILNVSEGILINSRTGETIPMANALKQGLLFGQETSPTSMDAQFLSPMKDYDQREVLDPTTGQFVSWAEAVEMGLINVAEGMYNIAEDESMTIVQGVKEGMITRQPLESPRKGERVLAIMSVYDPIQDQNISVTEAVTSGLLDLKAGTYNDPTSLDPLPVQQAHKEGLIKGKLRSSEEPKPEEVGDFKIKSAVDTLTNRCLQAKQAVQAGIIKKSRQQYWDKEKNELMSIPEAVKRGLVLLESEMPEPVVTSILQKSMTITAVVDPSTGREVTMSEAIGKGIFDPDQGEVINLQTGEHIQLDRAIELGLVSAEVEEGQKAQEVAVINGVLITEVKDPTTGQPLPLSSAIKNKIIDEENGLYNGPNRPMTLRDALKFGYIDGKDTSEPEEQQKQDSKQIQVSRIVDPLSGRHIGLEEAIQTGLVDENCTVYNNPITQTNMLMEDAMKEGLVAGTIQTVSKSQTTVTSKKPVGTFNITGVIDTQSGEEISVESAMNRGILDPAGKYMDSSSGNVYPLAEAMKQGLVISEEIQKSPSSYNAITSYADSDSALTFRNAMKKGLIKPLTGTFLDEASQKTYSVDEAVRTGMLLASDGRPFQYRGIQENGVTYSFKSALMTGIINSENCLFYDNHTGDTISIETALEYGYLSPIAGAFGGKSTGSSVVMLTEGVAPNGVSNLDMVLDSKTGDKLSLKEAEQRGLVNVVQSENKMTLNDAFQSGLVDSDSGLFHDPVSGKSMPLDEALLCDFVAYNGNKLESATIQKVNDSPYKYTQTQMFHPESLRLSDAVSQGLINTDTATFTDPRSQETITVNQALQQGFLKPTLSIADYKDLTDSMQSEEKQVHPEIISVSRNKPAFSSSNLESERLDGNSSMDTEQVVNNSIKTKPRDDTYSSLDYSQDSRNGGYTPDDELSFDRSSASTPISLVSRQKYMLF